MGNGQDRPKNGGMTATFILTNMPPPPIASFLKPCEIPQNADILNIYEELSVFIFSFLKDHSETLHHLCILFYGALQ
jgi:hypothetical protein